MAAASVMGLPASAAETNMTNPTCTLIALVLLLASTAPVSAISLDPKDPCVKALTETAPTLDLHGYLEPTQGTIIPTECGIAACPSGTYGAVLNDRPTCVRDPCAQGQNACGIQCPKIVCDFDPGLRCDPQKTCIEDCEALKGLGDTSMASPCDKGLPPVPILDGLGPEQDGPSCEETDDDVWPGGSHVSCHYDCPSGSVLAISVSASDNDAGVYGNTSCADQEASCESPTSKCADASKGVTAESGTHATCDGYSDEANSSPVEVMCYSIGLQPPGSVPCYLYPPVCQLTRMQTNGLSDTCAPDAFLADSDVLIAALSSLPKETTSAVAFIYTPLGGSFVRFSTFGPQTDCEFGAF